MVRAHGGDGGGGGSGDGCYDAATKSGGLACAAAESAKAVAETWLQLTEESTEAAAERMTARRQLRDNMAMVMVGGLVGVGWVVGRFGSLADFLDSWAMLSAAGTTVPSSTVREGSGLMMGALGSLQII